MNKESIKILLIDDDEDDFIITKSFLSGNEQFNFMIDWEYDYDSAHKKILENNHDIYLIDYRLGKASGIDLLTSVLKTGIKKPMIILTGQDDYQTDMRAMASGAADYLVKGELSTSLLERTIRYNLERFNNLKTLKEQEFKYRVLFERSLDSIFLADTNLKLLDANFSFRELFKISRNDVSDIKLPDLFDSRQTFETLLENLERNKYIRDIEVTMKDFDGGEKTCLISISRVELQEFQSALVQGIIKDITPLKQAEKELRKTEKLALTGNMARTIAHEIRNPLTNIILSLKQINKKTDEEKRKNIQGFLDIADKNAIVINNLIEELLQSSNTADLDFEKQDINAVIEASAQMSSDRIKLKNIKLSKELESPLPKVKIDFNQLRRAFVNVIINAAEAMEDSENPELNIRSSKDGEKILVEITDNGKGIEKEKIDYLFDAFYTGKHSGMGLGLTTVQNVTKKHNASVKVKSEPGKGTTFAFYFTPA